jgi:hypothetical protein
VPERGSTQHSPRVDDELEHETQALVRASRESHTQEWRQAEPPADGEPLADTHVSVDGIELRSILAISLRPGAFPADRATLLTVAEEEHAQDQVIEWLQSLPADREFVNVEAVWEALGGERERREQPPPPEPQRPHVEPRLRTEPTAQEPPGPSIVQRVTGCAVAGVELAVGLMLEAYQQIRKRL